MVKTQYVPVDNPKAVCAGYKIEASFKDKVYLTVNDVPLVNSDDEIEQVAKAALDDIISLDTAMDNLVGEVNSLEERCAEEEKAAAITRQETLESIDELNKS